MNIFLELSDIEDEDVEEDDSDRTTFLFNYLYIFFIN